MAASLVYAPLLEVPALYAPRHFCEPVLQESVKRARQRRRRELRFDHYPVNVVIEATPKNTV